MILLCRRKYIVDLQETANTEVNATRVILYYVELL